MLTDQIRDRVKQAMRSGDTIEKNVLRLALGEVQSEESRSGETLGDGAVEALLRKLVKSNRDTLAAGPSDERRGILEREIEILEGFLPKTLGVDEIQVALAPVRDAVRGAKNDGQATGVAMKHLKAAGAAVTGQDVAQAVKALRS
jgi:uncharacterized protein YqeY